MKGRARGLLAWGLVVLCLGLVALAAWAIFANLATNQTSVTIAGTVVKAQVISSEDELEKGLSGVERLNAGEGMLFVFPHSGAQAMWMKDMKINLDIIWLNENREVVYIERNVTPQTYPHIYRSPKPALYVLEVPAGTAMRSGIKIGTPASFELPAQSSGATMSS